ncbi:mediator of DNA damage checkpoint protein 1 [Phtheirospermum japonicum]|uniref:Mediator of DNA damage checkpoint protein 1 n=1 Tax=Phtheirospermum japonicum TaxID=374723 RepID=A0A830C9L3_9LAMI|nr:mediator of DNA damage checkpoint protein 1 [Phtheirospermum japonicum]
MARRGRRVSSIPSSSHISVGNCEVVVEAKNFTSESNGDTVQITLSKTAKVRISVMEKVNERDDFGGRGPENCGDCYFVLANPKDSGGEIKSLLQEVLTLYMKELPAMNYAANTGKESMFLERCVTNGKYCTLLLKSKDDKQPEEVIAAITYQIIPADTQYAEVPLAAVSSNFQHKGIGHLLYLELRKRLQNVGIQTMFCWGDKESEGFWLKQGFTVIGEVDKKGRARRLPIKAEVRRALCFPGGSTLMVSHLIDSSSESVELLNPCLPTKSPEPNSENQQLWHIAESHEPSKEDDQIVQSGCLSLDKLLVQNFAVEIISLSGFQSQVKFVYFILVGSQDAGLLPVALCCSVVNASEIRECGIEYHEDNCSWSVQGTKRAWEASCTSLKSKKVKGTHSSDWHLGSHGPVSSNSMNEKNEECRTVNLSDEDVYICPEIPSTAKCNKIMLMNIADDEKKSRLTKIIEDLGGVVASNGSASTHIVTGKVRKTLNFCTALCSGAWVISSGWLKESFKKGRFVDETHFILEDEDYRTRYRCELKSAVLRAKARPNALFKGLDIWLSPHVQPPPNTLSAIVESAGGNVKDMKEALSAVKMGIWTFSSEWLMNCIMRQELDLEAPQFAESL